MGGDFPSSPFTDTTESLKVNDNVLITQRTYTFASCVWIENLLFTEGKGVKKTGQVNIL